MELTVDLAGENSATITIEMGLSNPPNSTVRVSAVSLYIGGGYLPGYVSAVEPQVTSSEGIKELRAVPSRSGMNLIMTLSSPLDPGEEENISISLSLDPSIFMMQVRNNSDVYAMFISVEKPNLTVRPPFSDVGATVLLPPGAVLVQPGPGLPLLSPESGEVLEDPWAGRTRLRWEDLEEYPASGWSFRTSFILGDISSLSVQPSNNTPVSPTLTSQWGLVVLLVATNSVTMVVSWIVASRRRAPQRVKPAEPETALEMLDEDERLILEKIISRGGVVPQRDLPALTGFSKSKVSRILKRLDKMGVISRKTVGKTKMVSVSPDVRESLGQPS
ncbi:MAG: hypothetical protein DRO06_00385 [Thermoproteota archaeon]|nr:MAG: hypothetical protein DRO06_00385 [Candidatus Korarchaeota archaeon]